MDEGPGFVEFGRRWGRPVDALTVQVVAGGAEYSRADGASVDAGEPGRCAHGVAFDQRGFTRTRSSSRGRSSSLPSAEELRHTSLASRPECVEASACRPSMELVAPSGRSISAAYDAAFPRKSTGES